MLYLTLYYMLHAIFESILHATCYNTVLILMVGTTLMYQFTCIIIQHIYFSFHLINLNLLILYNFDMGKCHFLYYNHAFNFHCDTCITKTTQNNLMGNQMVHWLTINDKCHYRYVIR